MIHKVECVMLECDNCKKDYQNGHSGFSIFVDMESAIEDANNDEWYIEEDKQY